MAGFGYSEEYLKNLQGIALGLSTGVTPIVSGSLQAALLVNSLSSASTWAGAVFGELPGGLNGYNRVALVKSDGQPLTSLTDLIYVGDPTNRLTVPRLDAIFTATGGDLTWASCALGVNLPSRGYYTVTDISTSTGQLTLSPSVVAGDILVGDKVYLASPLNFGLPSEMEAPTTLRYIKEISGNLVKLATSPGGSTEIPTDKGTLPASSYVLKLAKGILMAGYNQGGTAMIYDGSPHEIRFNLSMFNSALVDGRDW